MIVLLIRDTISSISSKLFWSRRPTLIIKGDITKEIKEYAGKISNITPEISIV
jgi:hypothetical protein